MKVIINPLGGLDNCLILSMDSGTWDVHACIAVDENGTQNGLKGT